MVPTIFGCAASRGAHRLGSRGLEQEWKSTGFSSNHHTGLTIYDPEQKKFLFSYQGDQFFTPGSTVKLLTLYAALHYLDTIVPAAYYLIRNDSMIVWGGGDPGTYYPDIRRGGELISFIKSASQPVIFSNQHFQSDRLGYGWTWDDHVYGFQRERSAFPVYGNLLWVERFRDSIVTMPSYFQLVLTTKKDTVESLSRDEWGARYLYRYDRRQPYSIQSIPVSLLENDTRRIWETLSGRTIRFLPVPFSINAKPVGGSQRDSLLKVMMVQSDNFIAEQILLSAAMRSTGTMNEDLIIEETLSGPLSDIPDPIQWVDGSGLSRYNQMTPRATVWLLNELLEEQGLDYFKSIFPCAGCPGTLKDLEVFNDQPYIFAKSGSMKNVYCLSGALITRGGKTLLFSWMNNHFIDPHGKIKKPIARLLNHLREHY